MAIYSFLLVVILIHTILAQIIQQSWLEQHFAFFGPKVHFLRQILDYNSQILLKFEKNSTKKPCKEIRIALFYLLQYGRYKTLHWFFFQKDSLYLHVEKTCKKAKKVCLYRGVLLQEKVNPKQQLWQHCSLILIKVFYLLFISTSHLGINHWLIAIYLQCNKMPFIAYCDMQYNWKNSIEYSFLCVVINFVSKMKRWIEVIQFRHNFSKFFLAFCSVKISLLDFSPNWKIHERF